MSEPNRPIDDGDPGAEEGTELQFDEAEPTSPTPTGADLRGCKRPIEDAYYEINGKIVCASCSQQIQASFRGGSGFGRPILCDGLRRGARPFWVQQSTMGWCARPGGTLAMSPSSSVSLSAVPCERAPATGAGCFISSWRCS